MSLGLYLSWRLDSTPFAKRLLWYLVYLLVYCCMFALVFDVILLTVLWEALFKLEHPLEWTFLAGFFSVNKTFGQCGENEAGCCACLPRQGCFVLLCTLCRAVCPALREVLVLPNCISVNQLRNENIVLWREPFALLRWKDRRQEELLREEKMLINMWRDLQGRRNKIYTESRLLLSLIITAFSCPAVALLASILASCSLWNAWVFTDCEGHSMKPNSILLLTIRWLPFHPGMSSIHAKLQNSFVKVGRNVRISY